MRKFLFMLLALALGVVAPVLADPLQDYRRSLVGNSHYSLSGQFIVHNPPVIPDANPYLPASARFNPTSTNFVHLGADVLAVSGERIKKALLGELGMRDQWRGKIVLELRHAEGPLEPINIGSAVVGRDRYYRVELPDIVERDRLVATIVEVLLREIASRNGREAVEIPFWLVQGMAWQLQQNSAVDLVLEPPRSIENGLAVNRVGRAARRMDPLEQAHAELKESLPMTIADLSWPRAAQLTGHNAEVYRSSAQYLVDELLALPDGKAAMQTWLATLAGKLNWQLSFFAAFHRDFPNQLALEKWWALQLVQFTGRNLTQKWSFPESWQKLDDVLRPGVQVRAQAKDLPLHSQVTLATVIRDWTIPQQNKLLKEKVHQLLLLRMQVALELVPLVEDYRRTLDLYRRKSERAAYTPLGKAYEGQSLESAVAQALQSLEILETRRLEMRPTPTIATATKPTPLPNN